jgi:hypothetical protein
MGDSFDWGKGGCDFLGDLARYFFQALGQFKADWGGGFAQFQFGRLFQHDEKLNAVGLPDVLRKRVA